jgi:hypothetical protein
MIKTVQRRKIEVLVDGPLINRLVDVAESVGVSAYTLLPVSGGRGGHGRWSDDQLSGAEAKSLFVAVMPAERAEQLTEALAPLLDDYGLVLLASDVEVVRGGKF